MTLKSPDHPAFPINSQVVMLLAKYPCVPAQVFRRVSADWWAELQAFAFTTLDLVVLQFYSCGTGDPSAPNGPLQN